MADNRVSDEELTAAIRATEIAIRALVNVPGNLVDCDKISVRALRELQERRSRDETPALREGTGDVWGDLAEARRYIECDPIAEERGVIERFDAAVAQLRGAVKTSAGETTSPLRHYAFGIVDKDGDAHVSECCVGSKLDMESEVECLNDDDSGDAPYSVVELVYRPAVKTAEEPPTTERAKRFRMDGDGYPVEDPNGDWVKYDDLVRLARVAMSHVDTMVETVRDAPAPPNLDRYAEQYLTEEDIADRHEEQCVRHFAQWLATK